MADGLTGISDRAIMAWAGPMSYRLGRAIVSNGQVLHRTCLGDMISARCVEVAPPAQEARVRLSGGKIAEANCTCAVGEKGNCAHVVAVLLAFAKDPAGFAGSDGQSGGLERRSKSELIELINQLMASQPDSETHPDPVLAARLRIEDMRDPNAYRRYVAHAFQTHEFDYWGAIRVASELEDLLAEGERFLEQEDFGPAVFVFRAIATTILDYSETVVNLIDHDNGELASALQHCIHGVARSISGAAGDPEIRYEGLYSLLEVHLFDVNYAGDLFSGKAGALIIEHATGAEKALVASWLRANLPTGQSGYHHLHRQMRGRFLLELMDRELDENSILEICRECGLVAEAADRLLRANRLEEALSELAMAWDLDLAQIAEVFERHGHAGDVEPLLTEQFEHFQYYKLAEWLSRRHLGRGDRAGALPYLECVFASDPVHDRYRELRNIALDAGQWEDVRSRVAGELIGTRDFFTLVALFLHEGEVVAALELAERSFVGKHCMDRLEEAVSEAAGTHPWTAVDLSRRLAEVFFKRPNRQNYQGACRQLVRMRDLSRQLGLDSEWNEYIAGLRRRYPKRPALHEELSRYGL